MSVSVTLARLGLDRLDVLLDSTCRAAQIAEPHEWDRVAALVEAMRGHVVSVRECMADAMAESQRMVIAAGKAREIDDERRESDPPQRTAVR